MISLGDGTQEVDVLGNYVMVTSLFNVTTKMGTI